MARTRTPQQQRRIPGRPAARRPQTARVAGRSGGQRRPGVVSRRKQPPPSLASKLGQGALGTLKSVPAAGAAKTAGQNKSKLALVAGLGAAGAAFLKRRKSGSDATEPATTTVVAEPSASVPVAPVAGDPGAGTSAA